MEFEKLLLSTLLSSESIVQWQNALDEQFRNIAGDDYTMSLMSVGYGSFRKLKESCEKRYRYMERAYPLLPAKIVQSNQPTLPTQPYSKRR